MMMARAASDASGTTVASDTLWPMFIQHLYAKSLVQTIDPNNQWFSLRPGRHIMLMLSQCRDSCDNTGNQPSNHSISHFAEVASIWNYICHDDIRLERFQSHKGKSNHEEILEANGRQFARSLKYKFSEDQEGNSAAAQWYSIWFGFLVFHLIKSSWEGLSAEEDRQNQRNTIADKTVGQSFLRV